MFVQTDVRSESDIVRLMEAANQAYGHIDILINNAGISVFRPVFELSAEEWDNIINTNLRSAFLCSREAAKYMQKNKDGGGIVNIASTRAIMSSRTRKHMQLPRAGSSLLRMRSRLHWANTGSPSTRFPWLDRNRRLLKIGRDRP